MTGAMTMSYISRDFHSIVCDHPGCGKTLEDYATDYDDKAWYDDKSGADMFGVDSCEWQVVRDGDTIRHYCPDHRHGEHARRGKEKL